MMQDNEFFIKKLSDMEEYFSSQENDGKILRKSSEISEQARKNGNQLYTTQKGHDKQLHQSILLQYTKSIAFAPAGDEKLALGYSNRSALLMHLRRYEECISDIDKALEITGSKELKSKLNDRKARCTKLMKESNVTKDSSQKSMKNLNLTDKQITNTVFELPKIIKSQKALKMSKLVNIQHSKTYGRHLVANKDIKPGEIIIAEKCYACYPEISQMYLICAHCLSFAWNGIPCDSCAFAVYCSDACKIAAWQEYHDVECNILPYMYSDATTYGDGISLANRMFIKAVKAESLNSVMSEARIIEQRNDNGVKRFLSDVSLGESKFGTCYNLQSSPNNRSSNYKNPFHEAMIVYLLIKHTNMIYKKEVPDIKKLSDEKIFIIRDIFIKFGKVINLNQYSYNLGCTCPNIMYECENRCGLARGRLIAPYCSLANHSCIPNVGMLCLPHQKIVLYAIQPIKKNEQIFHSYGPVIDGKIKDRRNVLLQKYSFTCQCLACQQNWQCSDSLSVRDKSIYGRLLLEFQQFLHAAKYFNRNQFLSELPNQWQLIDGVSLHQALKLSELSYKFYENQAAFICNVRFKRYVRKALYSLYGENTDMLDHC